MTKLTIEQRETLADIVDAGNWEAVMTLCQISLEHHEVRLRTADIAKSDRELLLAKARYEGALDMHRILSNVREHVSGARKKA